MRPYAGRSRAVEGIKWCEDQLAEDKLIVVFVSDLLLNTERCLVRRWGGFRGAGLVRRQTIIAMAFEWNSTYDDLQHDIHVEWCTRYIGSELNVVSYVNEIASL